MVANEPGFELKFNPGSENCGADLLSRPPSKKVEYGDVIVTRDGLLRVEREKKGSSMCPQVWECEDEILKVKRLKDESFITKKDVTWSRWL